MKKIGPYLLRFTALSLAFMIISSGVLFLQRNGGNAAAVSTSVERKVIVIDAGHGGEDGGCSSENNILEKDINLVISKRVQGILAASGIEVLMTRTDDSMLYDMYDDLEDYKGKKKTFDLKNRIRFAKENNADLFISVHMNKFPVEKYKGLQVYYSKNNCDSSKLAESIKQYNFRYLQTDNTREIKAADSNIYVLDRLDIPAVLVECGFLSNHEECLNLCDSDYQNKLALVICAGALSYNDG